MPGGGGGTPEKLHLKAKARKPGYLYIYISNENPTIAEVYFDDMRVLQVKSPLMQYNEYYPFGLQTANSYTRENTKNNFLYNAGTELNSTSGMYDLFFRNYDPALGRMHGVDPMAGKYSGLSPYNYSFNDPVYWNDPLGDDVGGSAAFDKKFGSGGGGYEDPHAGGGMYGKSFDFTMHDAANGRADAAFNNLNTGFSADWNLAAYGSYNMGGSTFVKYGPGDGGALRNLEAEVTKGLEGYRAKMLADRWDKKRTNNNSLRRRNRTIPVPKNAASQDPESPGCPPGVDCSLSSKAESIKNIKFYENLGDGWTAYTYEDEEGQTKYVTKLIANDDYSNVPLSNTVKHQVYRAVYNVLGKGGAILSTFMTGGRTEFDGIGSDHYRSLIWYIDYSDSYFPYDPKFHQKINFDY